MGKLCKNCWALVIGQFLLDAVSGQVDADAAVWGRNKAADCFGWKEEWGRNTAFHCPEWNWCLALGKARVLCCMLELQTSE